MMFLSREDVIELTGRKVRTAQVKELNRMGIVHKVRGDGSVAVLTSHVEKVLDGGTATAKTARPTEPDWSSMNGASP
jgi:hypothetical protein